MEKHDPGGGVEMTKVLVADDNEGIRELVKTVLTPEGYEIVEAVNGERAYTAAVSDKPDLVLLDITMPVMDGFEVLQKLRGNPLTEAIPVVFITAMPPGKGELAGMKLGVGHYISKPFDSQTIKAVVSIALRDATTAIDDVKGTEAANEIRTGQVSLDKLLGGGVPIGSLTLIEGASSTGKSVLCQHFTHESLQDGHGVAYVTTGNTGKSLITQMASLGLEVSTRLQTEKLRIYPLEDPTPEESRGSVMASLTEAIEGLPSQCDVVIVDPITDLVSQSESKEIIGFFSSCKRLSTNGRTIFLVADSYAFDQEMITRVRSLCDADLRLRLEEVGESVVKVLEVSKLRSAERNKDNTISFEVEPGIGMRIIPVRRARV